MEIKYRIAELSDLAELLEMFSSAVESMEKNNIFQWDEIYPDEATLRYDVLKQQLYVGVAENQLAVAFVLNNECDEAYNNAEWEYKNCSYKVLHRFCVNPIFQNRGLGSLAMRTVEITAKNLGSECIRLDAFVHNPLALRMYEKLNYKIVGYANFRKGKFYLMEKKL